MPVYLTAERIQAALNRLASSRAKAALFDFLIVKRTFAIKASQGIAIVEREPAFIQALDELGACGLVNGRPVKGDDAYYINPFATREKGKQGYRRKRYRSNGTNSTIGGGPWATVISLSNEEPRKASLAAGYEDNLAALLLKGGDAGEEPSVVETAIWYFRSTDIEGLTDATKSTEERLQQLAEEFEQRVGLTAGEINRLFSTMQTGALVEETFSGEAASPLQYLPGASAPAPIVAADDVGSCSLDLVTALAAKNFVILTGPSGTGKSRSALRLAESIKHSYGDAVAGAVFELVTVGPDWTSPKRLIGYRTPFGRLRQMEDGSQTNESYEITNVVRLLLRASHPDVVDVPHFLIFDEMNLSHVERYFAPFLSLMEAANVLDEKGGVALIDEDDLGLIAELLKTDDAESAEARAAEALITDGRSFTIPSNVFFVGTVNVDETTYMFSPKVLDRAHVIELDSQRPSEYLKGNNAKAGEEISVDQALNLLKDSIEDREEQRNEFANPADILNRLTDFGLNEEQINEIKEASIKALDGCYQLLLPVGFPFGYRIPKEVFAYIRAWFAAAFLRGSTIPAALEAWPDALDRAVLQKVLPKIHGNRRSLGDSLLALASFLAGSHGGSTPAARYTLGATTIVTIAEGDTLSLTTTGPQMQRSINKLRAMHDRIVATGYVSFVS
jgi:energy-coupling factor transporter ATP-binding protein EcfA2